MTRRQFIQQVMRQVYGGIVSDDAMITELLANQYLSQAIGMVAKANYVESIKIDGVGYINSGFIKTYSGLSFTEEDIFTYKATLPQVPVGIGQNEGIQSLRIKQDGMDGATGKSVDGIPLSMNQLGINRGRRLIPNRFEYWFEGGEVFVTTTGQDLSIGYTAIARIVSGGDSTDLDSTLNVPDDYVPQMIEFMKAQLSYELNRPQDVSNDGSDNNSMK